MALSNTGMASEIISRILDSGASAEAKAANKEFWEKVCDGICTHIVNNLKVLPGISVSVTGTSTAQSGATTSEGSVE